jgi:hypothetical protein
LTDETEHKVPALTSGGTIRAIIPQNFDEAWRIGKAVCVAGMAPKGLDTPERATVAILHGMEIGLSPMIALQSIAIINGRPTLYGDTVLALIQASGKLETMKEWVEGQGDSMVALCSVVRRGDPEPKIGHFSVANAKQAKLWGKQGPWAEYPARMMKMRARSLALRDGFADVLRGMAIAEELRDAIEHNPEEPQRPTPPKPPAKSLSQPILSQPPVSSVQTMPPTPPKPPVKGANRPEKAAPIDPRPEPEPETVETVDEGNGNEQGKIYDPETGEISDVDLTPVELLASLEEMMATAKDETEVEEIWDGHDVEARLEGVENGDKFMALAFRTKTKHLKRVEG